MAPRKEIDPALAALSAIEEALRLTDLFEPSPSASPSVTPAAATLPNGLVDETTNSDQTQGQQIPSEKYIQELEAISLKLGELKTEVDKKVILARSGHYLENDIFSRLWDAIELKPGGYGIRIDIKKLLRL